ncbi:hypothetical protein DFH07DRAFT_780800 [Mycena maculata]|uniref:Secreted protein n=1 Tax=Mycena maculata TaxID=230809 RepID=A0AAD7I122_9AGAR|nr:hypothetical protein DFH07DRAFT_780800 [Mycena maculata]
MSSVAKVLVCLFIVSNAFLCLCSNPSLLFLFLHCSETLWIFCQKKEKAKIYATLWTQVSIQAAGISKSRKSDSLVNSHTTGSLSYVYICIFALAFLSNPLDSPAPLKKKSAHQSGQGGQAGQRCLFYQFHLRTCEEVPKGGVQEDFK